MLRVLLAVCNSQDFLKEAPMISLKSCDWLDFVLVKRGTIQAHEWKVDKTISWFHLTTFHSSDHYDVSVP